MANFIGQPVTIQNTDGDYWLVSRPSGVTTSEGESVSFTVKVFRGQKQIGRIEREAFERAIAMLRSALDHQLEISKKQEDEDDKL